MKNLKGVLKNFSKGREHVQVNAVATADVEAFLNTAKSAGTRLSLTNRLSALFAFAVRKKWIAVNPVDSVERVKIESQTPQILTVAQVRKLMGIVETQFPDMLTNVVLKLFAAVRPEEALKLVEGDIRPNEGILVIPAQASKTRMRRIVHLKPSTVEWLKRARELKSPVTLSVMTSRRRMVSLAKTMGFKGWPQDILRHTAISYWVAECRSAGEVALEAGNSEKIIKRHYLNMVTREEAAKFWAIRPS